jgi:hypothetical protein
MPMTFPASIFSFGNQDSCHRAGSSKPLNRNRFQFTARKQFCPLPFPTANFAYEKGRPFEKEELFETARLCCYPDCGIAKPVIGRASRDLTAPRHNEDASASQALRLRPRSAARGR